jgi:hypothetical protein
MSAKARHDGKPGPTGLLESQHQEVKALFERFDAAGSASARARVFVAIKEALSAHALLEEAIFYPAVAGLPDPEAQDLVAAAVEDHGGVKAELAHLDSMAVGDPAFEGRLAVLRSAVELHVAQEENDLFPRARRLLGARRLASVGERMARALGARRRADAAVRPRAAAAAGRQRRDAAPR